TSILVVIRKQENQVELRVVPNVVNSASIKITLKLPAFPDCFFVETGKPPLQQVEKNFPSKGDFTENPYSMIFTIDTTVGTTITEMEAFVMNRLPEESVHEMRTLDIQ